MSSRRCGGWPDVRHRGRVQSRRRAGLGRDPPADDRCAGASRAGRGGEFVDGSVALGHRRLAIIDLTPAAHQPMQTPDGRFVITYNGEIYNFRELRVGARGARAPVPFALRHRSAAPCAGAMGRQGARCASTACSPWHCGTARTAGAVARARPLRREAALLRGDRPDLPVRRRRSRRSFSTRPIARPLDHEALLEYFTFQNFFTDRTLFEGVRLLPAGIVPAHRGAAAARHGSSATGISASPSPPSGGTHDEYLRGARPSLPPGGEPAARERRAGRLLPQRRHGFGLDHRDRGAPDSGYQDLHRRLRSQFGLGHRARLRRARQGGAHVVPVQDRALRDGAEGGRHGTRHAAARLAPGRAAGRAELSEFLCGAAREQIRQGRAVGRGRRRVVRRLSVALLPRRRQRRLRELHRQILPLLAAAHPQRRDPQGVPPDLARGRARVDARHLPRRVPAPRRPS